MGSKKSVETVRINYGLITSGLTDYSSHTIITHIQRAYFDLYWISCYQLEDSELPLGQVSCFSGYPHHGLDSFAHIVTLPSLRLDFGSLAQCFAVDFSICFHQFLD